MKRKVQWVVSGCQELLGKAQYKVKMVAMFMGLRGLDERWGVVSVPGALATGSEYFPFSI
jgi:hypothetical protein